MLSNACFFGGKTPKFSEAACYSNDYCTNVCAIKAPTRPTPFPPEEEGAA